MMDDEGFITWWTGKDVIISGGENIYPVQIEDFLRAHEAIKDVAVIGLPDSRLVKLRLPLSTKPGGRCTEEEIIKFCIPAPLQAPAGYFDQVPRINRQD